MKVTALFGKRKPEAQSRASEDEIAVVHMLRPLYRKGVFAVVYAYVNGGPTDTVEVIHVPTGASVALCGSAEHARELCGALPQLGYGARLGEPASVGETELDTLRVHTSEWLRRNGYRPQ